MKHLILMMMLGIASLAGTIQIRGADPGSYANVSFKTRDGADESKQLQTDAHGNVDITFSRAVQEGSYDAIVTQVKNGHKSETDIKLPFTDETSFYDIEPRPFTSFFDVFFDLHIDVDLKLDIEEGGHTWLPGTTLDIVNGVVPGTSAITMGTFTGQVVVGEPMTFIHPVPEPATMTFIGLGLAGLGLVRRRK